ncbi:MAG: hypothetical protein K0S44_1226 [Bacteroidetes bacterium]|jgi:hypothetical protein|nr:hypothetical protein [Bacteroidota bacterium]
MVNIRKLYGMETSSSAQVQNELSGKLTLTLSPGKTLDEFCERHFDNYNSDQFEAVAIRVFYGKEIVVTLYALDKVRQEGSNYNINKIPVKKFKSTTFGMSELLSFISEFNFTLSTGNFPLEDMEVINK